MSFLLDNGEVCNHLSWIVTTGGHGIRSGHGSWLMLAHDMCVIDGLPDYNMHTHPHTELLPNSASSKRVNYYILFYKVPM